MDNINLSENINPISDLISDDVYAILSKNGLIDKNQFGILL